MTCSKQAFDHLRNEISKILPDANNSMEWLGIAALATERAKEIYQPAPEPTEGRKIKVRIIRSKPPEKNLFGEDILEP